MAHADPPAEHTESSTAPSGRPCRVCSNTQKLFGSFSKAFASRSGSSASPASAAGATAAAHSSATEVPDAAAKPPVHDQLYDLPDGSDDSAAATSSSCPPDSAVLGRATWTFLHTMAAYYPEKPSQEEQQQANQFLQLFAKWYPCHYCAEHLQQDMREHPPVVDSNVGLSQWMCELHNRVNDMLGKPMFDCSKVFERWRDGPPDGSCDGGL